VAVLLPGDWHIRIVDLNVDALPDDELRWADIVLTGGFLIQVKSMKEVVARAVVLKLPVAVVDRPASTACPDLFRDADVVFPGGAECRIDELVDVLVRRCCRHVILEAQASFPDIASVPVPRFDILDLPNYASVSVQSSLSSGVGR
jgi:hypothetical protein